MSTRVNVKNLNVIYKFGRVSFRAVKNVSIEINAGEIVGLIGESGSGKTSTAKAILGQIASFSDQIIVDEIRVPINPSLKTKKIKKQLATTIQMIYQSPSASLNPNKRVWKAIAEGMYNIKLTKEEAKFNIDAKQRKYVKKIFEFNKILKNKNIAKQIIKFEEILLKIKDLNKNKSSISHGDSTIINNSNIISIDEFYNNKLDLINNQIGSNISNMTLSLDSSKRRIKKMYKAKFENTDILKSEKIKRMSGNKKSLAKKTLKQELAKINDDLRMEIKKINIDGQKLKSKLKQKNKELKIEYQKVISEYSLVRSNKIKELRKTNAIEKNKFKIKVVQEKIEKKYKLARELDKKITELLFDEAKKQDMSIEFGKILQKNSKKLNLYIKHSRRPFGTKKQIKEKAFQLLNDVGLPKSIGYSFIPQLSGGQQQRVAIARAFAMHPKFIIADEPIASLDVSLQGSIVNLIKEFAKKSGTSILFITHDLEMVKRIASKMYVMYQGSIIEKGSTVDIFKKPYHPYTKMLISSSQTIDEALNNKVHTTYKSNEVISLSSSVKYKRVAKNHFVLANNQEIEKWGKNA